MPKQSRRKLARATAAPARATVSDFEVAFAAARDILEWPTVNLQQIALADTETQRKFVEWVKKTIMDLGGVESGGD